MNINSVMMVILDSDNRLDKLTSIILTDRADNNHLISSTSKVIAQVKWSNYYVLMPFLKTVAQYSDSHKLQDDFEWKLLLE